MTSEQQWEAELLARKSEVVVAARTTALQYAHGLYQESVTEPSVDELLEDAERIAHWLIAGELRQPAEVTR